MCPEKKRELRNTLKGLAFIAPNMLGFIVFVLFPILFSAFLFFSKWNMYKGLDSLEFVGLDNFINVVTDEKFYESLINNLIFILTVPITIIIALLLAVLIDRQVNLRFGDSIRAMFFIPYVTNISAICTIWMMLFQPSYGPINSFLLALGISEPPGWMSSNLWALPTIMLLNIWVNIGYNLVVFHSGLKNIPAELKEAARVDGASPKQVFFKVTLPLLSPMTFFLLITGIINSFKVFVPVNIMTNGGPGTATTVLVYLIYLSAFRYGKVGYAAVVSWILFLIILVVTSIQWKGQKKWVNYL